MANGPTTVATGAIPGAGAMPGLAAQRPTIIGFRRNGQPVWSIAGADGTAPDGSGAMPGQPAAGAPAGATPAAGAAGTPPAPAAPQATPPATGEQPLGDAGQRALAAERQARADAEGRAQAAERERDQLREAGASDSEKARNQAVREAVAAERATWQAGYREIVVEGALRGAGITGEKMLRLALMAPAFTSLKVTDDRQVEGVAEAIEKFKADYPEAFAPSNTPPAPGGAWDGSAGGGGRQQPDNMQDAVMQRLAGQTKR